MHLIFAQEVMTIKPNEETCDYIGDINGNQIPTLANTSENEIIALNRILRLLVNFLQNGCACVTKRRV